MSSTYVKEVLPPEECRDNYLSKQGIDNLHMHTVGDKLLAAHAEVAGVMLEMKGGIWMEENRVVNPTLQTRLDRALQISKVHS